MNIDSIEQTVQQRLKILEKQSVMKETIRFLDVLDIQRKKSKTFSQISHKYSHPNHSRQGFSNSNNNLGSLLPLSTRGMSQLKKKQKISQQFQSKNHHSLLKNSRHKKQNNKNKFKFFKALNFNSNKFLQYPQFLRQRQDFTQFIYANYQKKLLTIPKICSKPNTQRGSQQKYFVSLYLSQLDIFQGVPQLIMDKILSQIKTKNYSLGQIVHNQNHNVQFMGVIFVGSVEYRKGTKIITKERNQIIMSQAFYKQQHSTIVARQQTVILCIEKSVYKKIQQELGQQIYDKHRGEVSDLMKSDFFVELHLKQKRAKQFYQSLTPQFYFKDSLICQAGQQALKFYILFKGQITQNNHIYIRQHNKWPLPNNKWEVRAVYNSYQNNSSLKPFTFFADQEIINNHHFKSSYHAKTFTFLFSLPATEFKSALTSQDFKRLKKYRNQHLSINYTQFEHQVRSKLRSQVQNQSIIHKAISTSFSKKSNLSKKKQYFLESLQSSMMEKSKKINQTQQNEGHKSFFS